MNSFNPILADMKSESMNLFVEALKTNPHLLGVGLGDAPECIYMLQFLFQNMQGTLPFVYTRGFSNQEQAAIMRDPEKREYMKQMAIKYYRFCMYPLRAVTRGIELPFLQFNWDPFQTFSVQSGSVWLCDNYYYRFRNSFMMPVLVDMLPPSGHSLATNQPYLVSFCVYSSMFAIHRRLMLLLYRINPTRYVKTFFRKVVRASSIECAEAVIQDPEEEDDDFFTAIVAHLKLIDFEELDSMNVLLKHASSPDGARHILLTRPLIWDDLLVDYKQDDCQFLRCFLRSNLTYP